MLAKLETERARVRNGEESELMDLLISRKWLDMFGPFTRHPREAQPVHFHPKRQPT